MVLKMFTASNLPMQIFYCTFFVGKKKVGQTNRWLLANNRELRNTQRTQTSHLDLFSFYLFFFTSSASAMACWDQSIFRHIFLLSECQPVAYKQSSTEILSLGTFTQPWAIWKEASWVNSIFHQTPDFTEWHTAFYYYWHEHYCQAVEQSSNDIHTSVILLQWGCK